MFSLSAGLGGCYRATGARCDLTMLYAGRLKMTRWSIRARFSGRGVELSLDVARFYANPLGES